MKFKEKGILEKKFIKEGVSKKGNSYKKADVLVKLYDQDKSGIYAYCFDSKYNGNLATRIDEGFKEKDEIMIEVKIKAKFWGGRYYNELKIQDIYPIDIGGPEDEREDMIKKTKDGDITTEDLPF